MLSVEQRGCETPWGGAEPRQHAQLGLLLFRLLPALSQLQSVRRRFRASLIDQGVLSGRLIRRRLHTLTSSHWNLTVGETRLPSLCGAAVKWAILLLVLLTPLALGCAHPWAYSLMEKVI